MKDTKRFTKEITIKERTTEVAVLDTTTGEVFLGKATCDKADKFDSNYGIAVATQRAELKRNAMERTETLNDIRLLEAILEKTYKKFESLINEKDSREEKLEELLYC